MIELKDFTKDEREVLLYNFEYYSYLIWCKSICLKHAHNTLSEVVDKKYEQELWVAVKEIIKGVRVEQEVRRRF